MPYDIEDPYYESEIEDIFNDWYEIEGLRKIKELSRQFRTYFNYKTEVIRYRFGPNLNPHENSTSFNFNSQKQKIETLTHEFITFLKIIKKNAQTLELGIRSLFFDNNKSQLKKLLEITEQLFSLIHYFSEQSLHCYPKFLKFIILLAQVTCLVKKCLFAQFSEFFEELEINYSNLEGELEDIIETTPIEKKQSKKQTRGEITSNTRFTTAHLKNDIRKINEKNMKDFFSFKI